MDYSLPAEEESYQLVFEGPADDSSETMRKLKGVFIADLELSVDKVLEVFAQAPATVKRADSEGELKSAYRALKQAGGKVLIIAPKSPNKTDDNPDEIEFEFEFTGDELTSRAVSDDSYSSFPESDADDLDPSLKGEVDALLQKLESSTMVIKNDAVTPKVAAPVEIVTSPPEISVKTEVIVHAPHIDTLQSKPSAPVVEEVASEPELPPQITPMLTSNIEQSVTDDEIVPEPIELGQEEMLVDLSDITSEFLTGIESLNSDEDKSTTMEVKANQPSVIIPNLPVIEEPLQSATEEEEEVPEIKAKKKSRQTYGLEVALTLVISVSLLASAKGVLWLMQSDPEVTQSAQETPALGIDTTKAKKSDAPADVPNPLSTIHARTVTPQQDIRLKLNFYKEALSTAAIRITFPQPAPQTPEEIVRGVPPKPWLRKIEVDNLQALETEPGKFIAKGLAFAFVEDGDSKVRITGDATVTGAYDKSKNFLKGHIIVSRESKGLPTQAEYAIERPASGTYQFISQGDISSFEDSSEASSGSNDK